jgi:hypothetical protein
MYSDKILVERQEAHNSNIANKIIEQNIFIKGSLFMFNFRKKGVE